MRDFADFPAGCAFGQRKYFMRLPQIRRQGMLSLSVVPQHQDFSPGHKPSWLGLFIGDQRGLRKRTANLSSQTHVGITGRGVTF